MSACYEMATFCSNDCRTPKTVKPNIPALGGQSESGRGELRELHAARAGEVEISFAGDEEIPPDVHDQGLAVSGVSPGVVPRPGESVMGRE